MCPLYSWQKNWHGFVCDKRLLDVELIKSFEAFEAGFCDFNIIVIVTRGQSGLVHKSTPWVRTRLNKCFRKYFFSTFCCFCWWWKRQFTSSHVAEAGEEQGKEEVEDHQVTNLEKLSWSWSSSSSSSSSSSFWWQDYDANGVDYSKWLLRQLYLLSHGMIIPEPVWKNTNLLKNNSFSVNWVILWLISCEKGTPVLSKSEIPWLLWLFWHYW